MAELLSVCWFEIRGKISSKLLSSNTNYAAYLVFTCKSNNYGFEHQPAEASFVISGHESEKVTICLDPEGEQRQRYQIVPRQIGAIYHRFMRTRREPEDVAMDRKTAYPKQRGDGWMEVELGEHFVKGGQDDDLEVSLMEVKGGNWKSGLEIQGIEIRPKDYNK